MKTIEYVRVSPFATLEELKKAERRKAELENKGYTLTHESHNLLTYQKAFQA